MYKRQADYPLTIGSHSFIDTFEEQLVGKNIGEECEINVTFPEEYHAAELAGKPATFKVTVKEIKVKELPELDDEFAGEVSEFDTLDEYKKDIEAKILERKQKEAASENENRVVDKVVAGASMEIPDVYKRQATVVQDGSIEVGGKTYVVRELASQEMKNSAGATWDAATAGNAIGTWSSSFGDQIDIVASNNDGMGMSMFNAWSKDNKDRKSTRLNSSHITRSRMPSSA